jgi:hypothetical protein
MPFRSAFSIAIVSSGLLLAACGSSDTPTSNPKDPDSGSDEYKANGTLTVGGQSFPAHVSGLYDDTSVTLTVLANLNEPDTGWTLMVESRPARGQQPIIVKGTTLNGTHKPTAGDGGCVYTVKTGSANFDAWTPFMSGSYAMAKMSGSATLELTRWLLVTEGCPDVSMTLSFTNADATDVKDIMK